MSEGRALADVSLADLRAARDVVARGDLGSAPTEAGLAARGLGHLRGPLRPFIALGTAGLRAVLDAVIVERELHRAPELRLVWTGDDPGASLARHTRVLLPELFAAAKERVLVAGYSFDRPEELFAPLHAGMVRGVAVRLFVDLAQLELRLRDAARRQKASWITMTLPLRRQTDPVERGRALSALFRQLMWPFGAPYPHVYFDPRTGGRKPTASMHAKCVVVDGTTSLLTSANFTARGQTRNLEAGVVITDPVFARALELQWQNLLDAGVFVAG